MSEKEKFDISSLVSKDITELTASDAREGLDQFLLRSSGDIVDAGMVGVGEDEIVGDFPLMISDKVGGILTLLYISFFRCSSISRTRCVYEKPLLKKITNIESFGISKI